MKFLRLMQITSAASILVIASGPAFADATTVSDTGPGSNVDITQTTETNVDLSNSNNVQVTTTNDQHAQTGNAEVASNTTGGDATTGNATNAFTAATTIAIDNSTSVTGGGGVVGGSGGGLGGGSGGVSGGGSGGGSGGLVMGSSTGGSGSGEAATLPDVGAKFPVDVSYLRSLYNPSAGGSTVANQTHRASTMLFLIALLLSGLAGAGSYLSKRATSG